jgi:DNA-binding CsgD family transcriptional regulator
MGYGKSTLMQQHFAKNTHEKCWIDNMTVSPEHEFQHFIKHHDDADATLYIDNIHLLKDVWLTSLFANLPVNAKVIISSRSFNPKADISLTLLNEFQVLDYHQLKLNFTDISELLPRHSVILAKDVFTMSLGWPVLVAMICNKVHLARDIVHLKHIVNSPPSSLANFAQQTLIENITGQQQQFLVWLSIVETLPKALFSNNEQILLDDYCEHELNGLVLHHESSWQLMPLLKNACFLGLHKSKLDELRQCTLLLSQRFLGVNDIKSAITLLLQIGEKEKAIEYLSQMGGMLEWIKHGLTNLIELNNLFSQQDAEQYEPIAWLACIVNYKLGNVSQSRQIVNFYWQKQKINQLAWTTADAMIKLHEGLIFEPKHLAQLTSFAKDDSQTGPFTGALINNLLAVALLQTGENDQSFIAATQAKAFYQELNDAQYGQTFINIHQSHSLILSVKLPEAKQLLSRTNSEIQTYFNKDKSIRIALQVVKLELNFLSGLMPAVRSVDQLIKKLTLSESWFDLYATLIPIAIKLAILQRSLSYIPKWFAIVHAHIHTNPMAYLNRLLSKLALLVIVQCPELKVPLNYYLIEPKPDALKGLPWRLQLVEFELMWHTNKVDVGAINKAMTSAKKHKNQLLYSYAKTIKALVNTSPNKDLHSSVGLENKLETGLANALPIELIKELEEQQLFGLLWQVKDYVAQATLNRILKEHNRLSLFSYLPENSAKTPDVLSKKEQHIHKLLRANLRNKQIALELDISEQTVKFHLKNIYRKLGVKSRQEATISKKT